VTSTCLPFIGDAGYSLAVRIATWNVNSIAARLRFVQHWLAAREPDVVCIQETKVGDDKFPAAELAGYTCHLFGQAGRNGVAVLTRGPATVRAVGLPGAESAGSRVLAIDAGDLTVVTVYVPNGKTVAHPDFTMKVDFLGRLAGWLRTVVDPVRRVVVGGDFNVAHRDADSWSPEGLRGTIFHTDAERAAMDAILDTGLADAYRVKNPDGRMFSWWDYRAGCFHKNQGLRIDLVLATPPLLAATREVWIDRDYRKKKEGDIPSDHAPVIADVD
jgi:exodeoxyribonuclease III